MMHLLKDILFVGTWTRQRTPPADLGATSVPIHARHARAADNLLIRTLYRHIS